MPPTQTKNVLMIAYVFPPIAYAGTYRTLRFCRYLPENGWLPSVVTIKHAPDLDNDIRLLNQLPPEIDIYRTPTIDFWRMWERHKKTVRRSKAEISDNDLLPNSVKSDNRITSNLSKRVKAVFWEILTIPDHMVFWVPFAIVRSIGILLKNHIDLVYTTSPPHSSQIIGLVISRALKKPWVADFRDPILDSSGYKPPSKIRFWVDRTLEKIIVQNAHNVLIISDHYKQIMEDRYPSLVKKFITVQNSYDPTDFENIQPAIFNKFTIIYSGTFYSNRNPQLFLQGFGLWYRDQPPEIQQNVQVIFYGLMPPDSLRYIEEAGLEGVIFAPGIISKEELIPQLKGAGLLLLIIGFDPESRGTITSKIFEYMACNRPILAIIPEGDASDILKKYKQTYCVNSEDKNLIYDYLCQAYRRYSENGKDDHIEKVENHVLDAYNARYQTQRLADIFNKLLS
jgi:glycosyltransferase involved in cell wall biosynthesis